MSPRKALQDRTNLVYNIINPHFEKKFGVSFAEGLIANKKLKLSKKPTCDEKKKEKQGIIRNVKRNLEQMMQSTVVDRYKYIYIFIIFYVYIHIYIYTQIKNTFYITIF